MDDDFSLGSSYSVFDDERDTENVFREAKEIEEELERREERERFWAEREYEAQQAEQSSFNELLEVLSSNLPSNATGNVLQEAIEDARELLSHETVNVYAELGIKLPYPVATWYAFDEPGLDDIYQRGKKAIERMADRLKVDPVRVKGKGKMQFLGAFEIKRKSGDFTHPEAIFLKGDVCGYCDYLCGMPYGVAEMLCLLGSRSTVDQSEYDSESSKGAVPPVPANFFDGYDKEKVLMTRMWSVEESIASVLLKDGVVSPNNAHWIMRVNFETTDKFPIPGEYLAMCLRAFPNLPWGEQKTSPIMFSGNFMDTVHLSAGRIMGVQKTYPYWTYSVEWRNETISVRASDYVEYETGQKVCLLRNVKQEGKKTWTWKDAKDDKCVTDEWVIVPFIFYGKENPKTIKM